MCSIFSPLLIWLQLASPEGESESSLASPRSISRPEGEHEGRKKMQEQWETKFDEEEPKNEESHSPWGSKRTRLTSNT